MQLEEVHGEAAEKAADRMRAHPEQGNDGVKVELGLRLDGHAVVDLLFLGSGGLLCGPGSAARFLFGFFRLSFQPLLFRERLFRQQPNAQRPGLDPHAQHLIRIADVHAVRQEKHKQDQNRQYRQYDPSNQSHHLVRSHSISVILSCSSLSLAASMAAWSSCIPSPVATFGSGGSSSIEEMPTTRRN